MTWLSMRAKTDKTLLELTQDMKQVIATTNTIAQEIHKSGQQEAAILRQQLSAIASRMNLLVDITTGNDNRVERLRASLEQLQVAIREAANTGFKQEESSQYFQP
jgi:phage terminase large subunit-like protein